MGVQKLARTCLALSVVICCITAASAWAAPPTLVLKTAAGPLASGAPIRSFSSDSKLKASNGLTVECAEDIVAGTLTSNGASADLASITAQESKGHFEVPGACKAGETPVLYEAKGFPWKAVFSAKGIETLSGKIEIKATFPHLGNLSCLYEAKRLSYSFNLSGPVTIDAAKQLLMGAKLNEKGCPESGEFSGTFNLTSNGETVEAEEVTGAGGSDGTIEGTVTGAGDVGVEHVRVTACEEEETASCFSGETGAGGHYVINNVPEGGYLTSAAPQAHSGYGITAGKPIEVFAGLVSSLNVELVEAGGVSGIVTGTAHATQSGVTVSLCNEETETLLAACRSTTTDGSGEFSFSELPDGTNYVLTAEPTALSEYAKTSTAPFAIIGQAVSSENLELREAGTLRGTVTDEGNAPVQGAVVSACDETGACPHATTNASGEYEVTSVADGLVNATVSPPAGYAPASMVASVVGHAAATENFLLKKPAGIPPGTTIVPAFETEIEGVEVPVVNWEVEAPITTTGCVHGVVTATITGVNRQNGDTETTSPVTLTESPALSGSFSGKLPRVYPIHGETKTTLKVSGCAQQSEEEEKKFTLYIDPSGLVVDGNAGDAPVFGATVTLLTSDTLTGTYAPVPNGSTVMSPANRLNPGLTNAAGEFGWDTLPGYYRVQATKEDCGTVTTPAFEVPPPVTNLKLVLHCLLRVETSSLPEATRGTPYEAKLTATGADTPFKWKKTAALPKGLKLSKTGTLSGTLSAKHLAPGNYTIAVEVTDSKKHTAKASLTLKVN